MEKLRDALLPRVPLIYVFLSGIGFSIQALTIKVLSEQGFKSTFQFIFVRGIVQMLLSVAFIVRDTDRLAGNAPKLFGNSNRVRLILFLRTMAGFVGIALVFLALELIPLGDATVLMMLSPLISSILGFLILGEPWRFPEFLATVISLTGAILVAKPPFIFGSDLEHNNGSSFYFGVGLALSAALSAAFAYIFVRMLGTTAKMPWANVCLAQSLGQVFLSIPSLYIFGQSLVFDMSVFQYLAIVGSASLGACSQILMTLGMQREKSAAATAMRMSDVVFGFVWQSLFTQDPVSILSVTGAVLVASSILIVIVFKQKSPPEKSCERDVELEPRADEKSTIVSEGGHPSANPLNVFTIVGDGDEDLCDEAELDTEGRHSLKDGDMESCTQGGISSDRSNNPMRSTIGEAHPKESKKHSISAVRDTLARMLARRARLGKDSEASLETVRSTFRYNTISQRAGLED